MRHNKVVIAKMVCEYLANVDRDYWVGTQAVVAKIGFKTDGGAEQRLTRRVMQWLEHLGILQKKGTGKFRWRLVNRDYDKENPLKTKKTKQQDTWLVQHVNSVIYVTGDTYDHKEKIKEAGGKWDGDLKKWWLPETQAEMLAIKATEAGVRIVPYVPTEETETEKTEQTEKMDRVMDTTKNEALTKILEMLNNQVNKLTDQVNDLEKTKKVEMIIKRKDKPDIVLDGEKRVHPILPQVMFHIECGDNVLLVGPKGCGKTFLAMQIADKLECKYGMLSLSGGVTESKLFGRNVPNTRTGENVFHATKFVELYEKGGLFLLDELDAADPNVVIGLNSAIENGILPLDRTKQPEARRHKDFVCIGAANTWGNGANRQYVGRNQQDSAFLERFVPIAMDYDEVLEKSLCPGNEEMVTKLHEYRKNVMANRVERTISTRFICRAHKWMEFGKDLAYVEEMLFAGWKEDEVKKAKGTY